MRTTYPIIHINSNTIHAKKRISIRGRSPPLYKIPIIYFELPSTITLGLEISQNINIIYKKIHLKEKNQMNNINKFKLLLFQRLPQIPETSTIASVPVCDRVPKIVNHQRLAQCQIV